MESEEKDCKQGKPKQDLIRNVCILAHVDHGKTTIADALVASNGHISDQSAGTIRFLDDRKDEQKRGITVKSSAITLVFKGPNGEDMILNLVDTPGHIDFSSEVMAAIRLCDGALIVVDVYEGVCVQTKEAIKLAFDEHLKMILVINKIDRVIINLEFTLQQMFTAITRIIEDCNAFIAGLCQYDIGRSEKEEEIMFAPFMGNVIFASAVDNWGLITKQVAALIWEKLGEASLEDLDKKMWNFDYYVSSNSIKLGALEKKAPNLFVSNFLKTIFHIYNELYIRKNYEFYNIIIEKLKIKKETPDMRHSDPRRKVRGVFHAWSGLASIIFKQISELVPPPTKLSLERSKYLIRYKELNSDYGRKMLDYLSNCLEPSNPAICYVSKMFAVNKNILEKKNNVITGTRDRETVKKELEERKNMETSICNEKDSEIVVEDNSNKFIILALARVFSGTIKVGQEMYILYPKYEPPDEGSDLSKFLEDCPLIQKVTISQLYILLGRNLQATKSVTAGNICGIGGLDRYVRRTGTLSSTPYATPLLEQTSLEPIVWNTIKCKNPLQEPTLRSGLEFLKQVDSSVQVNYLKTGELVLVTAGDVHLSKCLMDIQTFAEIDLDISNPMVSLKETIISNKTKINFGKSASQLVSFYMEELDLKLNVVAVPLPSKIINTAKTYFDLLKCIDEHEHKSGIGLFMQSDKGEPMLPAHEKVYKNENVMQSIKEQLEKCFKIPPWQDMWSKIWSIDTNRENINILFNNTDDYLRNIFTTINEVDQRSFLDHCVTNGFQMCCRAGPICEEPITNCAFIVNKFEVGNFEPITQTFSRINIIGNQLPSLLRDFFRSALEKQQPRIMEPIFTTDIEVTFKILGKVYSVVQRRHGKVLEAVSMDQQERIFLVKAQIPVAESDGFATEMRTATSGQANANLRFSHFEIIDGDPYFKVEDVEADDDEDSDDNDTIVASKRASEFRKIVRKRKGLKVDDQVVIHAEKQRTLNKKK